MVDTIVKKAGDLVVAAYKPNLITVVSDPDIPDTVDGLPNPDKESFAFPLGDLPLPKGKFEPWDVTPDVTVETANLTIIDSVNAVITNGNRMSIDLANNPPSAGPGSYSAIAVAKTNLTLESMVVGNNFHYGMQIIQLGTSPTFMVSAFMDKDLTVSQVETIFNDYVLSSIEPTGAFIATFSIAFGANSQTQGLFRIPNSINPSPTAPGTTFNPLQQEQTPIAVGTKTNIAIGLTNAGVSVGFYDIDGLGNNSNVIGAAGVTDTPVDITNLRLYYIAMTVDYGGGFTSTTLQGDIDTSPTGVDFSGSTYERLAGGTLSTWNALFPNGFTRPDVTTVVQKTFPEGTQKGFLFQTVIDSNYSGSTPQPYGKTVSANDYLIVEDVTNGGESFVKISTEAAVQALGETIDDLALLIDTQDTAIATLTQQLTDAETAIATNTELVGGAFYGGNEVVVYLGSPDVPILDVEGITTVVFYTFDDAYNYLVSLPYYQKKRIVIENRFELGTPGYMGTITGEPGVLYQLMENNITISSFSQYVERFATFMPVNGHWQLVTNINLNVSSIKFDDFSGGFVAVTPIIAQPIQLRSFLKESPCNFNIGDNCNIQVNGESFDFPNSAINMPVGNNSVLKFNYGNADPTANNHPPLNFVKGVNSKIELTYAYGTFSIPDNFITITTWYDSAFNDFTQVGYLAYNFWDADGLNLNFTYTKIIRVLGDLVKDNQGRYVLPASNAFLFVANLDLGTSRIYHENPSTVILHGLPGVTITTMADVLIENRGKMVVNGLNLVQRRQSNNYCDIPVILNTGYYRQTGGGVKGCRLFNSSQSAGLPLYFSLQNAVCEGMPVNTAPNPINLPSIAGLGTCIINNNHFIDGFNETNVLELQLPTIDATLNVQFTNNIFTLARTTSFPKGIVELSSDYAPPEALRLSEVITVTGNVITFSGYNTYLFTKNGAVYDHQFDPLIKHDDKKYGVTLLDGTAAPVGNGYYTALTASPVYVNGFYNATDNWLPGANSYFLYASRKRRTFLITLKADAYSTESGFNTTFTLYSSPQGGTTLIKTTTINVAAIGVRYPVYLRGLFTLDFLGAIHFRTDIGGGHILNLEKVDFTIVEV